MAIVFANGKKGFNRQATQAAPEAIRPAPVVFSAALAEILSADKVELTIFGKLDEKGKNNGADGAYVKVLHGAMFDVPFNGEVYRNGPATPRCTTDSAEAFIRSLGLQHLTAEDTTTVSQHGEMYTVKQFTAVD